MKDKIKLIAKKSLGNRYNYYSFLLKTKTTKSDKKIVGKYNNEEVIVVSVDNPRDGKSVGGKHIHIHLLRLGMKENFIDSFLVSPEIDNRYGCEIKDLMDFYNVDKKYMKTLQDIEFAGLAFDWIKQLENGVETVLAENKVKVFNCHDVISTFATKRAMDRLNKNVPIVTTLHGYFSDENVDYGGLKSNGYLYNFFKELEREAYRVSDKIIAVDTRIKNYVLSECSEKREEDIVVIKNAINDNSFTPVSESERLNLLNKYGLMDNVIFVPRRLVPKNGVRYVVQSVNSLIKQGINNFKLIVAGDGLERNDIEKYLADNNIEQYVQLLGDITHDKINDYFKLSKIVIVPSVPSNNVEEATSLSALEGMAVGKVTIATAIGGLKELIVDGENGYLVKAKDVEDMAEKINAVLQISDEKYKEIAKNARNTVVKNHGYKNHALDFYSIFKSVMR